MRINKTYIVLTFLFFVIEVMIAVFFKSGFIRHTFGDFLVVILIYCFIKSFLKVNSFKLAFAVLLFALTIEFLQFFNILNLLNLENNKTAILILGSTFHISDLVAYTFGIITFLIIDLKFISNE